MEENNSINSNKSAGLRAKNNDISMENLFHSKFQSQDPVLPIEPQYSEELKRTINDNTQVEHPTTYLETLMHLFKGNIGSGIFAMGDAYKNAGIAMAPWLVVCLGVICVHTQHILLNASNKMKAQLNLNTQPNFAETVELCFIRGPRRLQKLAPFMRHLVNIFLCMGQLGFCCVYFVFISTNLKQIFDSYGYVLDLHYHTAILLFPIILSCMVRNLKYLIPFSVIANILMLYGIAVTLYYSSRDLPSLPSSKMTANLEQFPLFFGTALYAVEGIFLVLPLQREMKKPEQFSKPLGVLNVGMTFITFLYILVGFLSYLKYGEDVKGSVTLNLPEHEILAQSVKISISLGILLSYALQFYIPIQIVYTSLSKRFDFSEYPLASELTVRTVFVLLTFVIAETVPYLEFFISLVGALCSTTVCLIIPPIMDLVQHWTLEKISIWVVGKDFIILCMGLFGCITGSYESIRLIIGAVKND